MPFGVCGEGSHVSALSPPPASYSSLGCVSVVVEMASEIDTQTQCVVADFTKPSAGREKTSAGPKIGHIPE